MSAQLPADQASPLLLPLSSSSLSLHLVRGASTPLDAPFLHSHGFFVTAIMFNAPHKNIYFFFFPSPLIFSLSCCVCSWHTPVPHGAALRGGNMQKIKGQGVHLTGGC